MDEDRITSASRLSGSMREGRQIVQSKRRTSGVLSRRMRRRLRWADGTRLFRVPTRACEWAMPKKMSVESVYGELILSSGFFGELGSYRRYERCNGLRQVQTVWEGWKVLMRTKFIQPNRASFSFQFQGRRCIDATECRKRPIVVDDHGEHLHYKPLPDGTCDIKCPNGYYVDPADPYRCLKCVNPRDCVKSKCKWIVKYKGEFLSRASLAFIECVGGSITSLNDAENYKGCNIVSTHLDITIQSGLTSK